MSRRDVQKECFPITCDLETRKGVPTNRAGTPDWAHLEGPKGFAKPFIVTFSWETPRKCPDQTFGANKVAESTFTPGPIVDEIATRLM